MKKILVFYLFLFLIAGLQQAAHAQNTKKNLDLYLNSLDVERTIELHIPLGVYDSPIIPPSIGRLVNLRILYISGQNSSCYGQMMDYIAERKDTFELQCQGEPVVLPVELFALPKLETLSLGYDASAFIVNAPLEQIKATFDLKTLRLYGSYEKNFDLWPLFINVENIEMRTCFFSKLPDGIYKMKKLKRLSINSNLNFLTLDERINNLESLEEINFERTDTKWPSDLSGLKKLKKMSSSLCTSKEKLNEHEDYYFPLGILTLPNLEYLTLFACGRLEMPPRQNGLKHLKSIDISSCDVYTDLLVLPCREVALYSDFFNFDNLITYKSLEQITFGGFIRFDTQDLLTGRTDAAQQSKEDGRANLIESLKEAYKNGKLPHLRVIYDQDPNGDSTIPVFVVDPKALEEW